jgi:hypothetical protein
MSPEAIVMSLALGLRAAGALHLLLVAANVGLAVKIDARRATASLAPFVRQVFFVHWIYLGALLSGFGALLLAFADELASGTPLARSLCGALAVFWLSRVPVQLIVYDRDLRRANRVADASFTALFALLGALAAVAALAPPR